MSAAMEPIRGMASNASYYAEAEPEAAAQDIGLLVDEAHGIIDLVVDGLQEEGGQIESNPKTVLPPLRAAMRLLCMVQALSEAITQRELARKREQMQT
jgi:hypothetical protein